MTSIVALIPARAGSKRIPGKNTKLLAGHPLINYTAVAAERSGIFDEVVLCSDSDDILNDEHIGPFTAVIKRYPSGDGEADVEWIRRVVDGTTTWGTQSFDYDAFAILRCTSPFRTAETIRRAWELWRSVGEEGDYDALRAIEPCRQHPAKMWTDDGITRTIKPLLLQPAGQPWHSSPTQTLPRVYVQNASLEIAWTETVRRTGTMAGERILAFETGKWEGFDINTIEDWWVAERAIAEGVATLPEVN